jgi:NADP-reducing hydrogenase subunit HndB
MSKISIDDLKKIAEKGKRTMILREGEARAKITVHMGTCGIAAGARGIMSILIELIGEKDAKDVILTTSGCAGLCSREPMATVEIREEPPVKYIDLTPEKIKKIFHEHVFGGKIVNEYALGFGGERVL